MQFNCDRLKDWLASRRRARLDKKLAMITFQKEWHVHYAWLPTKVAPGCCFWLASYLRKRYYRVVVQDHEYDRWRHHETVTLTKAPGSSLEWCPKYKNLVVNGAVKDGRFQSS